MAQKLKVGFSLTSLAGVIAEMEYNSGVALGETNLEALEILVMSHLARYPLGVDAKHKRVIKSPLPTNGFDHKDGALPPK